MTLLPLFEIVIKHGILDDAVKSVQISVYRKLNTLIFSTVNHIKTENIDLNYRVPLSVIKRNGIFRTTFLIRINKLKL